MPIFRPMTAPPRPEMSKDSTILALNPKGYGPPVLAPCPCRACAVLRARDGGRREHRDIKGDEE